MIKKLLRYFEYLIAFARMNLSSKQFIFLASVLVGISVSFAVIVLKSFAHGVYVFATYVNGIIKLSYINSLLPIIGIFLTVFVVKRFLGGSIEKGTSQILHAMAKKSSKMPKKQMYAQIVTSSLTVGLGGSAGLESPITITGAAFGSNFAQTYKLTYKERTLLMGCGVAAGIGAAFNAPIAGVLFAIEVLLVDVTIAAFTPIMISAATGAIVSAIVLKESVLLSFTTQQAFDYHNTPFYILLGLVIGAITVLYARWFQKTEKYLDKYSSKPYKKALIGSVFLAILIFIIPTLFGEGYESIKTLSANDPGKLLEDTLFKDFRNNSWALLLFVGLAALLKAFATGLTLGSGGNGGNFAPSLFLGSYVGFFFSQVFNLTGLAKLPVSNFTLVGMAGVLSGLFHAPLTAIFLIAEITGGYGLMIPLMIVSSISFAVSKKFEKHSIDVKELAKKGHVFTSNKDSNILITLDINSIIITNYAVVSSEDKLSKIVELLSQNNQFIFPVLNIEKQVVGVVYFNQIRDIIFNDFKVKYTSIEEVMVTNLTLINYDDSMEMVMDKFDESKSLYLPVIKNGKYHGVISKAVVLEMYRSKLKSMSID